MRFLLHAAASTAARRSPSRIKGQSAAAAAVARTSVGKKQEGGKGVLLSASGPKAAGGASSPSSSPPSRRQGRLDARRPAATATTADTTITNSSSSGGIKTWGQQCSPNCGCVVRIETTIIDNNSNNANTSYSSSTRQQTIISSTYHAKTVLSTVDEADGTLRPRLTQRGEGGGGGVSGSGTEIAAGRGGRPMLVECECPTLHSLSRSITSYITDKSLRLIINATEFTGVRSSPSFRRTVLVEHGLDVKSTGCYDLVEEAFVASLKGYMVKERWGLLAEDYEGQERRRELERRRQQAWEEEQEGWPYEEEEEVGMETVQESEETPNGDDELLEKQLKANHNRFDEAARKAGQIYPSYAAAGQPPREEDDSVGMPAFHLSDRDDLYQQHHHYHQQLDHSGQHQYGRHHQISPLEGRYDDALNELCRDDRGWEGEERTGKAAVVLADWVAYVDELYRARDKGQELA